MQAAYDKQERRAGEKQVVVRAFLTIKARQIEYWADSQIDARSHLPVFLRKLVHSTGNDLRQVDFPGYDNAQRKGSDGFVEAGAKYRAWAERLHFDYPYVGRVLEEIPESYEREAGWQDTEATIQKRIRS